MANNQNTELAFRFAANLLDDYNPPITGKELRFVTLASAQPRRGRLITPNQFAPFQDEGLDMFIVDFGLSFDANTLVSWIYAFGVDQAFYYDMDTATFIPFEEPFEYPSSINPFGQIAWNGLVYTTRENQYITKYDGNTAPAIIDSHWQPDSGDVGGRYAVVNNGHMFIGSTVENGTVFPTRIRWSDLNNPENWVVDPTSEADFFDLEPTVLQITGLTSQYGFINIYTANAIWQGTYVGLPEIYQFQPLKTGIGCIYHYGVIQVKQIDYFIGYDSFYMLNGTILEPIGDQIWRKFQEDNPDLINTASVRAYHDPVNTEIFWTVYPPSSNEAIEYVFNYQNKEWSTRNSQNKHGYWFPWEAVKVINGDEETEVLTQPLGFVGTDEGEISKRTSEYSEFKKAFYNESGFPGLIQTFEFNMETLTGIKEVHGLKLLYKVGGAPTINLYIGHRKSQLEELTWLGPVQITVDTKFAGESTFYFREFLAVDKFLAFRLEWSNTNDDYIEEFYGMSLLGKIPVDPNVNR